ncbi:unnamed protein product [Rhizophagus irregularis]|nr:unnamed protein product [Rhizophagus irregularis]
MPRKTKRQQQVSKISRKKGHYVSQDQVIIEDIVTEEIEAHEGADHNIRAVYTGNSRTTVWRKGKEKQKLENETKGMKTLDTFFKSSETLYSPRSS